MKRNRDWWIDAGLTVLLVIVATTFTFLIVTGRIPGAESFP